MARASRVLKPRSRLARRAATGCLLCGDRSPWREGRNPVLRDDQSGLYRVVRCASCGHVQLSPIPSESENLAFYAADRQTKNVMGDVDFELQRRKAQDDTTRRVEWLKATVAPAQGKVLDLGSGYGFFVDALQRAGYDAGGLEPGDERIALARRYFKAEFLHRVLDEQFATAFAGRVIAVTAFHVIEHVVDPVRMVRLAMRPLAPGGFLLVEVPNFGDQLLDQVPEYRAFFWQRAHVSYFDRAHLALLLRKAGATDFTVTGVQRYGIRNLLHWLDHRRPQLESPDHQTTEPALKRLEALYKADREQRLTCDTLIATIRVS